MATTKRVTKKAASKKKAAPLTAPASTDPTAVQIGGTHYKYMNIQQAEFSQKNNLNFLEGSVIKRMCRHSQKAGVEDLKKAIHEIQLIAKYTYGVEV